MSGDVTVRTVETRRERETFIRLPWRLYQGDPNWVPPLLGDMRRTLTEAGNSQFKAGPHALALAWREGPGGRPEPVGRLVAGVNETLNRAKGAATGYISLFESVQDYEVARALFDWAVGWLRDHGCASVKGPVSPTNGDDFRGLLVMGFDSPPVLMDSYNPPYYVDFFERYGFTKDIDLYAYRYRREAMPERYDRVAAYAMRRYGFRCDRLDLKDLDRDIRDIKTVLDLAMPGEWADLIPPTLEELRELGRTLRPLADPCLSYVARSEAGEPIGFIIGLPNYNEVLARLNGRLFPTGFVKFLWYRRRIRSVRIFVLFVVPEWRKRGVTGAMFWHLWKAAGPRGYEWGEGSTIGETNEEMRRDAERAGGEHYKTYRIYRLDL